MIAPGIFHTPVSVHNDIQLRMGMLRSFRQDFPKRLVSVSGNGVQKKCQTRG